MDLLIGVDLVTIVCHKCISFKSWLSHETFFVLYKHTRVLCRFALWSSYDYTVITTVLNLIITAFTNSTMTVWQEKLCSPNQLLAVIPEKFAGKKFFACALLG